MLIYNVNNLSNILLDKIKPYIVIHTTLLEITK